MTIESMQRLGMQYFIGQQLAIQWETVNHAGKPMTLQIPVKVQSIDDHFITVVEDREENAMEFNLDGTMMTTQGTLVLVERKRA